MKKIALSILLLCLIVLTFGCERIDGSLAAGSIIAGSEDPNGSFDGYEGGDSGGDPGSGIWSFSEASSGSNPAQSLLPNAIKKPAVCDVKGIGIYEGTSPVFANDVLNDSILEAKNQLKTEKNFDSFFFLVVHPEQSIDEHGVKLKLDESYRGKVAYMYYCSEAGNIVKTVPNSSKDYISYKLDSVNFKDDILKLDFPDNTGYFVIVFGAK